MWGLCLINDATDSWKTSSLFRVKNVFWSCPSWLCRMSLISLPRSPQLYESNFPRLPHYTFSFPAPKPRFPPTRQEFVVFKVTRSIGALVDPKTHLSTNNVPVASENPHGDFREMDKVNLVISLMLSLLRKIQGTFSMCSPRSQHGLQMLFC